MIQPIGKLTIQDHRLIFDEEKKIAETSDIPSFTVTGYLECRDKYGCVNVFHGRENCKN